MTLTYRRPTSDDIAFVADHMRQDDVLEVAASHGHTPLQALVYAITESDRCYAAVHDGIVLCIFGYARFDGAAGVWLLGTDYLVSPKSRRVFLRETLRITDRWAGKFTFLFNFVDAQAATTLRWLRWLGFREVCTFDEFGAAKVPFVLVEKHACVTR